ncbi:MAG: hypothetical protein ACKOW9_04585 [Candidatus Paceibacterota bacterium]
MSESTLGLEIDGDQVTVVETIGEMAVSVRSLSLEEVSEAVDLVLAGYKLKRNDPPMRVSSVTNKTIIKKIDVTNSMSNRSGFEEGVYQAVRASRENTVTAGIFEDVEKVVSGVDALTLGYAVIAPRESVNQVFNSLGKRKVEVVTPAFTIPFDGLWLGVRYTVADLTLIKNGKPVAYRQLPAGGLSTVIGALTDIDDLNSGKERLQVALHRSGPADPIAESELDRYLRLLATETKQTLEFFTRDGEVIPDKIFTYGPGSVSIGFEAVFTEMGLTLSMPEELTRQLGFIPPADRPVALGAYFAAVTTGKDSPYSSYPDPRDKDQLSAATLLKKKTVRMGLLATAVASFVVYNTLPSGTAYIERNSLLDEKRDLQEVLTTESELLNNVLNYRSRSALIADVKANEINLSIPLRIIKETSPTGSSILQITASPDKSEKITLTVSADKDSGSYNDLSRWLSDLRRDERVNSAWSNSFTNRSGKTSFQLSVVFDIKKILRYQEDATSDSASTDLESGTSLATTESKPSTSSNVNSTEMSVNNG